MKKVFVLFVVFLLSCCAIISSCTGLDSNVDKERINYTYNFFTRTLTITGNGEMSNADSHKWEFVRNPIHVIVEEGITSISPYAFHFSVNDSTGQTTEFDKTKTVKLPESLIRIGDTAFDSCKSLKKIDIPDNVIEIGYGAFTYTGIEKCVFPNKVKRISSRVCSGCSELKVVKFGENVEVIEEYAFLDCEQLSSITLPKQLKNIGSEAFLLCTGITEILIPESVEKVGNRAFAGCDNMKIAVISSKDIVLGKRSFGYKNNYKKIKEFTIKGYKGSTAEQYAKENGFKFIALDE